MIKKYFVPLVSAFLIAGNAKSQTITYDTIYMDAGYVNQVYYDMKNGEISKAAVKNWDIAHTSDLRDNCIRANHMTGLQVIPYKGPAGWANFDTTGWKSWGMDYNNIHNHMKGAFNLVYNAPWGFGWGTYNSGTHEVVGDSMYLLAWTNGSTYVKFMKFEPIKQTVSGDLVFHYADVTGTNEVQDTLFQSAANQQNYKFYQFGTKSKPVREPANNLWDITFTRYYEPVPTGPSSYLMYPVMGVESNRGTKAAKIIGAWSAIQSTDSVTLRNQAIAKASTDMTAIGSGWKVFDNGTFKWTLADTQSFVVRQVRGSDSIFYLIHFTGFGGSADGRVEFAKSRLGVTNAVHNPVLGTMRLFPNPASQQVYVNLEGSKVREASLGLYDLSGKLIRSSNVSASEFSTWSVPVSDLAKGIYVISIQSGSSRISQQITVQ